METHHHDLAQVPVLLADWDTTLRAASNLCEEIDFSRTEAKKFIRFLETLAALSLYNVRVWSSNVNDLWTTRRPTGKTPRGLFQGSAANHSA